MTPTIECTNLEFRKMTKEFIDALPSLNKEELESGWHCIGVAYLGVKPGTALEEIQFPPHRVYSIVCKEYTNRLMQISSHKVTP